MSDFKGTVYIICFDQPYLNKTTGQKCMHYIGFATFLGLRMAHHRNGTGSSFLKAVNDAGITYIVSRVFNHVDREFERKLKKRKKTKFYCPRCSEKPYNVLGYIEPPKPQKRSYRIREFMGNLIVSDVIINSKLLIERLAKRFRVGETFILNGKFYTRVNKRYHKNYFDIDILESSIPEPTKEVKDLIPTNKLKFQEYIRDSIEKQKEKSENQVVEQDSQTYVPYHEEYDIPF